jgi:hypothetical protein
MVAVGGDLEALLALGTHAVRAHQRLQPLLADAHAVFAQLWPDAWSAVSTLRPRVNRPDVHQ